ncbi:MAG: LytTR family transcriptional regulator [Lachnospiraceae bacterium]|nr:LytTR family transcriptional regulator [Lachnospiraceae bacterium]
MTKPIIEEELFDNLEAVMEELSLTDSVSIMRRSISHNILIKDICYLSAQSGGSELWSKTDMYYCEESLLQWKNKLPEELFFRCHHKYLVNFACITKVEPNKLTLINGERIPVSRRKWKEFQIAYMRWDAKYN